jgi:hypothetical protein
MKPIRLWIGLVLVALGVFGILDATGALDSSETIEQWWPVAIIGLGIIGMLVERRVGLGPAIVVGIGFLLLADQQQWTDETCSARWSSSPTRLVPSALAARAGGRRGIARTRW